MFKEFIGKNVVVSADFYMRFHGILISEGEDFIKMEVKHQKMYNNAGRYKYHLGTTNINKQSIIAISEEQN